MQSSDTFNEYAVLDLGSNSFHMIIARRINHSVQIIYKNKRSVRLALGLDAKNELSQRSIDSGIDCLAMFAERLNGFPTSHVRIVATHTLRVATNRHKFIEAAASVMPYPIEIISGQEEARLIYTGIVRTEASTLADIKLTIDIGGGSTEMAVGRDFEPYLVESRPMGCVTYTHQFFPDNRIDRSTFNRIKLAAEQQVEKIAPFIKVQNISIAYGSSGTIKSVYNILLDIGVDDGIITPKRLDDLTNYILEFKNTQSIDYPSVSKDRKMILVAGLAIMSGLFKAFDLKELHYSHSALREGVLYEMAEGNNYHDVRQNTAIAFSKQYLVDERHAKNVVNTAQYFFQQWQARSPVNIGVTLEAILYWAALLHEVGLSINFSSIHKHSAYILQNSNMPGFNQEQQLLLATLVRYHRKSLKLDNIPHFSLFNEKQIISLLQLLRLAVLVNNQRASHFDPAIFQLKLDPERLTHIELVISRINAENNRLILLDLEQEQAYWGLVKHWQLTLNISDDSSVLDQE